MTVDQVDKLIHRIKLHKPNFMYNFTAQDKTELKKIWCEVLWDYDSEAVNLKLDEFLSDSNNSSKNIMVYSLIEGLTKKTYSDKEVYIRCKLCNQKIKLSNYDIHINRCNSIEYLQKMLKKYSMKVFSKQELQNLSEDDFESLYWKFLKIFKNKTESVAEKHYIDNAIRTHFGQAPNLNISEILNSMSKMNK